MDIHLYMSCYRSEALIASHLTPEAFGRYMAIGTQKLTRGSYMFIEVDRGLKSDYFKLDDLDKRCVPHEDGSPKASKYVSVYRVLEHVPRSALGKLYLVTADGRVLGLEQAPYEEKEHAGINLYQELCPLSPMVISATAPSAFAAFMTSRDTPLCVPRLLFADLLLDHDLDGRLAGHLPYADPLHLEACIAQLEGPGGKRTKTVSRNPTINAFYRTVRRGFFVADEGGMAFYPYPVLHSLETQHAHWWRSAQLS